MYLVFLMAFSLPFYVFNMSHSGNFIHSLLIAKWMQSSSMILTTQSLFSCATLGSKSLGLFLYISISPYQFHPIHIIVITNSLSFSIIIIFQMSVTKCHFICREIPLLVGGIFIHWTSHFSVLSISYLSDTPLSLATFPYGMASTSPSLTHSMPNLVLPLYWHLFFVYECSKSMWPLFIKNARVQIQQIYPNLQSTQFPWAAMLFF